MKIRNLKERFKAQAKMEKGLRKILKVVEEKRNQNIDLKKLEETRTEEIYRRIAHSVLDPMKKVIVTQTGDIGEFFVKDIAMKHEGILSTTNSIWAPWSKSYGGLTCK